MSSSLKQEIMINLLKQEMKEINKTLKEIVSVLREIRQDTYNIERKD